MRELWVRISKCATSAHLGRHRRPQMQQGSMLIDLGCGLRAAIAIRDVELEGGDAMLTEGAFECGAAIHRFGGVISHIFIVVLPPVLVLGIRCATLEQEHGRLVGTPCLLVPGTGLEPARLAALDPKSSASANSAIPAW